MATNDKYDRQLRLWGSKGQKALSETTVVLIRATAVGTETLKNLVLPGIGRIFVLDDVELGASNEYSCNFFLTQQASGKQKTRAEMALCYLQELNPDVQGSFRHYGGGHSSGDHDTNNTRLEEKSVQEWIATLQEISLSSDSHSNVLVIGSDLEPNLKVNVSQACETIQTPIIHVTSYGFIGMVRIQTPPHALLNPKPSSSVPDLRLFNPFPELQQFADSIPLLQADSAKKELEDKDHGHVPYPIVLIQLKQKNTKPIETTSDKEDFKLFIKSHSRDYNKQLNFQEAVQNAYLAYTAKGFDRDQLEQLLLTLSKKKEGKKLTKTTSKLYVLLQALDQFLQQHQQQPPLHGTIPDMTSSTDHYVQLQNIYKQKAQQDRNEIKTIINQIATKTNDSDVIIISDEELDTFCKNIHTIDLLDTGTLENEYNNYSSTTSSNSNEDTMMIADPSCTKNSIPEDIVDDLNMATYDPYEIPIHTPLLWYFGLRACFLFHQQYQRYPGTVDTNIEKDVTELQDILQKLVAVWNMKDNEFINDNLLSQSQDIAQELTRYGNAQIHTISSYIGGVASQEAVKIITGQYVPINNTFVYNGIASVGAVYKF